ncbi:DinB family protein [Virgibacillus xinjiangensis]|uniref:DinB family protein n=1 Tax=Virgibacillus xinjiangensis TaxID=393090 RepID=A0ABV7CZ90_9BACI
MKEQFNYTRDTFLAFVENLDETTADKEASYFNNTIRWHIGHVLVTPESLLFGFPKHSANLPEEYNDLFGMGTKPADWKGEIPDLEELASLLKQQKERISKLEDDFFAQELPYELPFGNFQTYGDIFHMILQHENEHLGKMKAMKQVVTAG